MRSNFKSQISGVALVMLPLLLFAAQSTVYVIPVTGMIDLGLAGFVERQVEAAKRAQASVILVEIDTFGGRVDAAVEITRALEQAMPIPTVAYVTNQAWSAGALIALACDRIIMAPGASIGSAEPRMMGMGTPEETDEKSVSAIRAKFRAVAEAHGHSVHLAQAMVDKDLEIVLAEVNGQTQILPREAFDEAERQWGKRRVIERRVLSPAGKMLNLTAQEAVELGLARQVADSRQALLATLDLAEAVTVENHPTWSEALVRFITNPIVSSLLLTLGFLGLIGEFKAPGWGLPGTFGVTALALFFWGHHLIGLANWTEILLFVVGVALLVTEILLLPGFGIPGVLGLLCLMSSVFLAMVRHPFRLSGAELASASTVLAASLVLTVVFGAALIRWLPKTRLWRGVVLAQSETSQAGFTSAPAEWSRYVGQTGTTTTGLRPSGKAQMGEALLDVTTEGEFIPQHQRVKVIRVEGSKIVVRAV